MQRDAHLTFGKIYESREALLEDIERVIDIALVDANNDAPLRLRFITPLNCSEDWYADENTPYFDESTKHCDYRLTRLEEHTPGLDYVTVSYCWKHSQSLTGLQELPEYRIHDSIKSSELPSLDGSRHVNCPKIVFNQAIQFARQRRCPYIRIDQECIDQKDPADIKQHLQVMHRIYSKSR
jgi:hypothetical protein